MQLVYDIRADIDASNSRQQKNFPEIKDPDFWRFYETSKPYSMLHITGFFNIYQSVRYLSENKIAGDMVECGAFLGGSSIFIVLAMRHFRLNSRLWVFDTFAGFPPNSFDSKHGKEVKGPSYASFFEAVKTNFATALGIIPEVNFVQGDVCKTLPATRIGDLSLLRLDTDFYDSTKAEMEILYPKLVNGGVLTVDDYGCYDGSRRAVDEYFTKHGPRPLLNRIDSGVFSGVKP
jgi:O-methyltransferase